MTMGGYASPLLSIVFFLSAMNFSEFVHQCGDRFVVAAPFDRGGFATPTKNGDVVYSNKPDAYMGWHYAHHRDAVKRAQAIYGEQNV